MNLIYKPDQSVLEFEGNNEKSFTVQEVSMEEVMLRSQRKDTLGRRILIRALGMVAYVPELTYELDDVDRKIVDKMLRYPELLKAIDDWISVPDQELLLQLREAARVFTPLQRRFNYPKLFRGFDPKSILQDTMGL